MSVRTVRRMRARSEEFAEVYDRLLRPAFPRTELVDLAQLIADNERGSNRIWCAVSESGTHVGVAIVDLYGGARAALLSYLVVEADHRGGGIGGDVLKTVLDSREVREARDIYLEIDDPRVTATTEATGDPWARVRFYRRFGAKAVDVAYRQPPVRPGAPEVGGMILCRLPTRPDSDLDCLRSEDVRAFLQSIGSSVALGADQNTVALLRLDDVSRIPLSR